jgi:chromosome segregation ATPase
MLDQRVAVYDCTVRALESDIAARERRLAGLRNRAIAARSQDDQRRDRRRALNRQISEIYALIDRQTEELRVVTEKCRQLKAAHLEMQRRYGIRSVDEQQTAIDRLEEEMEREQFSNPQLRKRISRAGKMRRKVDREFVDMAANEAEQKEARARRAKLREAVAAGKEKRVELFKQREAIEKEIEDAPAIDADQEIAEIEKENAEKKEALATQTRRVIAILEAFFKSVDEFVRKAAQVAEIDRKIEASLPPEAVKPRKGRQ